MKKVTYKRCDEEVSNEDSLEELKAINAKLKKDLEIAKLKRENRELVKQIQYNEHYDEGTITYGYYATPTPTPYNPWDSKTWVNEDGKTTITLCGSSLSDSDKKEIISNIKSFLAD